MHTTLKYLAGLFATCVIGCAGQTNVNIGSAANAGDGDSIRTAFTKVNTNFTELYTAIRETGFLLIGSTNSTATNAMVLEPGSYIFFTTNGNVVSVHATPGGEGGGAGTNYVFSTDQFTLITGTNVFIKSGALLTNVTLTTPTIASFWDAQHDHQNRSGGGTMDADAISTGEFADARMPSSITRDSEWDTSSEIAARVTDETGSGALVFGTSPTLTTPAIANFSSATHTHQTAAQGSQLTYAAISGNWPSIDVTNLVVGSTQTNTGTVDFTGVTTFTIDGDNLLLGANFTDTLWGGGTDGQATPLGTSDLIALRISDETGSPGLMVFSGSPVITNLTATAAAIATGNVTNLTVITGQTNTGTVDWTGVTSTFLTGDNVLLGANYNDVLVGGTTDGQLYPVDTSDKIASRITDETGSPGPLVFGGDATITNLTATTAAIATGNVTNLSSETITAGDVTATNGVVRGQTESLTVDWEGWAHNVWTTNEACTIAFTGSPTLNEVRTFMMTNSSTIEFELTIPSSYDKVAQVATTTLSAKPGINELVWTYNGSVYLLDYYAAAANVDWPQSAQAAASGTDWVVNFAGDPYRSVTLSGDINLLQSTNRPAGPVRSVTMYLVAGGSDRALTWNSDWMENTAVGKLGGTITAGTAAIVNITAFGSYETNVVISGFLVQ